MLILTMLPSSLAFADPDLAQFGLFDKRYTWEFTDLSNYTLSGTAMNGGTLRLESANVSETVTSRQDFENGTINSLDSATTPGALRLEILSANLISNTFFLGPGNFSDSYISNGTPGMNFGGVTTMLVGNDAAGFTYRTLLDINESALSYLPWDAVLVNASLTIFQTSSTYGNSIEARTGTAGWNEGSGDWNGTIGWLWVNETTGVGRTNEPVIVNLTLPMLNISDPERQLVLYDASDTEYPSRLLNETEAGGYFLSIKLGIPVTSNALQSKKFALKLLGPSSPIPAYRTPAATPYTLWTQGTGDIDCAPAIADLDLDGKLDFIIFNNSAQSIDAHSYDGALLWSYGTGENLASALTAADVNQDGSMEILFAAKKGVLGSGGLKVLTSGGALLYDGMLNAAGTTQPAVADVNLDGAPEIVITTTTPNKVYCLSGLSGANVWNITLGAAVSAVAIGNINATAGLETALVMTDGRVEVYDATGAFQWQARPGSKDCGKSFAIADLNGDSVEDIIFGENNPTGPLFALNGLTGILLWTHSVANHRYSDGLAVADINQDGANEVITLSRWNQLPEDLEAFSSTGVRIWNCSIPSVSFGAISLVDYNGDGDPEIFVGDRDGNIQIISSNGVKLTAIRVSGIGTKVDNSPVFADLTGNGTLEMVTTSDFTTTVTGLYGFSHDWRITARDCRLASTIKALSSAEGVDRLAAEWAIASFLNDYAVNWTHALNSTAWLSAGGDFSAIAFDSFSGAGNNVRKSINITQIIANYLISGKTAVEGIYLLPADASPGLVQYASTEDPVSSRWPTISITYRIPGYAGSGNFTSALLSPSSATSWQWISANWSTETNTTVSVEMRAGNSTDTGDPSWTSWTVVPVSGDLAPLAISEMSRYVQVRALLSSTNLTSSPLLKEITVGGIRYAYHGWATTNDVIPPDTVHHWNQTWAEQDANGGSIYLNFSTNGGANWISVGPTGDISMADASAGKIRLRVDIFSDSYPEDSASTPLVFNVSATYVVSAIVPQPPYISPNIPDQVKPEDALPWTVDLTAYVHDVNDPNSLLRWYTLNESFIAVTGENVSGNMWMTLSAPSDIYGSVPVTFVLVDTDGSTATQIFNVTIVQVNDPPVIDAVADFNVSYDAPYVLDLTPYVHDAETPKGLLNITALGPNATYVTFIGLVATFLIPQSKNGTDVVFTLAVDDGSLSDQTSFTAHVQAATPPYISPGIPDQSVMEDSPIWSVDLASYIHDDNDPNALLRWYVTNESFATIFGENMTGNMMMIFSVPGDIFGSTQLGFVLIDSDNYTTTQVINLTVASVNDGPEIDPIPDMAAQYDVAFDFNFSSYVRDIETPKAMLNLSIVGANASYVTFAGLVGTFLLPQALNGTTVWFTISVDDGDLSANTSFAMSVAAAIAPFILPSIPDQAKTEDAPVWSIDLTSYLHDSNDETSELRWYVLNESFISVFGENVTGNMIMTFSIPADVYGSVALTFVLVDSDGMTATQVINVTVTSVNDLPYIFPDVPDQTELEDSPSWWIDLTPYFHDQDDPAAQLHWYIANKSFISITGENVTGNMIMTFSIPADVYGSARLTLFLVDPDGASAAQTLDVVIIPVNDPPVIAPAIPNQVKQEDAAPWSIDLGGYIHDDSDPQSQLRWYTVGESFLSIFGENITGNMIMVFVLPANVFGTAAMTIVVTDSKGASSSLDFMVTVTPINDQPAFEFVSDFTVHYEMAYSFNFAPYVRDAETPRGLLNLTATGANSSYVTFSELIGTFLLPKILNGTNVQFTIAVDDGDLMASITLNVLVSSDYTPELTTPLPDIVLKQGEFKGGALNLTSYFSDVDDTILFLTVGNSHVSISIDQRTKLVDFRAPTDWYGIEEVVFRAIDPSNARAEDAIIVTVLRGDSPPNFWQIPNLIVRYNESYQLDLAPYVHDLDTPIPDLEFIVLTTNASTFITFSEGTMTLLFPFDLLNHTIPIDLEVSDGGPYPDRTVFNVRVVDDYPPVIISVMPDFSFIEDHPTDYPSGGSLSDFFDDVDIGDSLTYAVMVWDANVTATVSTIPGNVTVGFTQTPNWSGATKLTIRATDTWGAFAEKTIALVVTPQNDLPEIGAIATIKVVAGIESIIDIASSLSDVETQIEMLLISSNLPQYVHGLMGDLYILFPVDFTGGRNVTYVNLTLKIRDLDGGESIGNVTIMIQDNPEKRQTQDAYLWWFILTTGAIAGLMSVIIGGRLMRKPFIVSTLMLIHNNGLLLARSGRVGEVKVDDDVFSGMLTAVLSFVEDSFKAGDDEMKGFEFKNYSVALQRGAHSFIVVAYSGSTPKNLESIMKELMDKIENIYGKRIENYSGEAAKDFAGMDMIFNAFIHDHSKNAKPAETTGSTEKL